MPLPQKLGLNFWEGIHIGGYSYSYYYHRNANGRFGLNFMCETMNIWCGVL